MGVVHRPDPSWASHMPVLIKALELTDGPVLELGAGMFSTPLLHTLCRNRYLQTYESDSRFTDTFKKFRAPQHHIVLIENWDEIVVGGPWSVVLVDQRPAEARSPSIRQLIHVDYVVIHDSNDPIYDYESIYPLFRYRYDYKKFPTWTTVLSNKHDVYNQFHNTFN